VKRLQAEGKRVMVMGDGVNDAVAFASSDDGIATGAGARRTVDAANVVFVRSDLRDPMVSWKFAVATIWCIMRKFGWACVFNSMLIPVPCLLACLHACMRACVDA